MFLRRRPTIKSLLLLTATYAVVAATLSDDYLSNFAGRPVFATLAILVGVVFWALPFLLSWVIERRVWVAVTCGVIGSVFAVIDYVLLRMFLASLGLGKVPWVELRDPFALVDCTMTPAWAAYFHWNRENVLNEKMMSIYPYFGAAQVIVYALLGWLMAATFTDSAKSDSAPPENPIA
jgi:hypothetical protein